MGLFMHNANATMVPSRCTTATATVRFDMAHRTCGSGTTNVL